MSRHIRLARWVTLLVFFLNGFAVANWFTRIPAVQDNIGIGEGTLGTTLTGIALGSLLTMPVVGGVISRMGSRLSMTVAIPLLAIVFIILSLAPSVGVLFFGFILFGVATGMFDVSMNSQGVAIEEEYGRPLMSTFTAAFSIGGLVGAIAGGFVAGQGIGVFPHFVGLGMFMILVTVLSRMFMLPANVDASESGAVFARPSWTLLGLMVVVFAIFVAEGAAGDWSAIYLSDSLGTGAGFAAYGFAAFAGMQTIGRLSGDWLMARVSAAFIVRIGAAVAAIGLGLGIGVSIVAESAYFALIGFGSIGLGIALILPAALTAAGQTEGAPTGPALAALGVGQYSGAFLGAPAIGVLSEVIGLGLALLLVVGVLCLVIIPLAGVVGTGVRSKEAEEPGKVELNV